MARNKWTEYNLTLPHRHTISLGYGLIKIRIHRIDVKWAVEYGFEKEDAEEYSKYWLVYINRQRIPELDSKDIEEAKKNCVKYLREKIADTISYLSKNDEFSHTLWGEANEK